MILFQTPEENRVVFLAQLMEQIGPEIFGPNYKISQVLPAISVIESLEAAIIELSNHWHPCCVVHNDLKFNNVF